MQEWIVDNKALLWWLAAGSVLTFLVTLVVIPLFVVRIPEDYFTRRKRQPLTWWERHTVLRVVTMVVKNVLGVLFVAAGLAMLVLPGQGFVTIFMGLMLADFPGKFRLERWVVQRGPVIKAMNWIRARAGRPPIQVPPRRTRRRGSGQAEVAKVEPRR